MALVFCNYYSLTFYNYIYSNDYDIICNIVMHILVNASFAFVLMMESYVPFQKHDNKPT